MDNKSSGHGGLVRLICLIALLTIALGAAQAQSPAPTGAASAGAPIAAGHKIAAPPAPTRISWQPAAANPDTPHTNQWINGNSVSHSYFRSCFPESQQILTTEYVGYYGATDASFPRVGDLYWMHLVVGVVGSSCVGGADVNTEVTLPAGTRFATGGDLRIRCYYQRLDNNNPPVDVSDDPNAGCPVAPSQGVQGQSIGFRIIPNGGLMEIQFPVYSTRELHGIAQNDSKLQGMVQVTIAGGWTFPYQWVFVAPNPPTVAYQTPAVANVTATGARTRAVVWNHYTAGQAFFDLGTTADYGVSTPPLALSAENLGYTDLFADWTGLQPNTTYHWRIRYVTNGVTYAGPDQTFTTAAAAPETVTVTLAESTNGAIEISPAGGSYPAGTEVTITARPDENYRFERWTINGADGGTANPRTIRLDANTTISATFAFVDPVSLNNKIYLPAVVR